MPNNCKAACNPRHIIYFKLTRSDETPRKIVKAGSGSKAVILSYGADDTKEHFPETGCRADKVLCDLGFDQTGGKDSFRK